MRYLTMGAILAVTLCAAAPARAQATDPALLAPIHAFLEAFNKGDIAGAAATHSADADLVIIDEVSPYIWRGAKAFTAWASALEAHDKAAGVTDQKVTLGTVTRAESDGTSAYVVVPSTYTFKEKGVAMQARAQMTFALKKGAAGWSIHGWTWTGPKAATAGK
jgi:hypothetical protein